jgi:hypothetical protein
MAVISRKNIFLAFLFFILSFPALASSIFLIKGKFTSLSNAQQRAKESNIMDSTANFTCIKFDPTATNLSKEQKIAYAKYQDFMLYGYPTDVPLSQAIKEFNDCFSEKEESQLTENEVIAALIDGDDTVAVPSNPEAVAADLKKIVFNRLFPKGAMFVIARTTERSLDDESTRAAFNASKIIIKRWVITLYRGLDRNPIAGTEPFAPGQVFVIRKRYYNLHSEQRSR